MRTTSLSCLLSAAFVCTAEAQRLAAYDPVATMPGGAISEIQPPTPMLPGPVPPIGVYPTVPALPPVIGPAIALPGDSGFDNLAGLHWYTNGLIIAAMPTPTFPPAIPVPAPFPVTPPVLAAIGGGPVTGLAYSSLGVVAGPILYLCGAPGIVIGVAAVPAMPVVVPPFPIPFLAGAATGLEWDGATGSLWACDAAGTCYNFMPGGAPLGPPVFPPIALPAPAGDVAIDKTLRVNGAGFRPLYVVAGPMMLDVLDPVVMPFPHGLAMPQGLAFMDHPAANPPVGTCLCPTTTYPTIFTTSPMAIGNPAWGLGVGGMPPGWPVLFVFDFAFLPGFPLINGVGCGLGLTGAPIIMGVAADAFGNAVLSLSLTPPILPLGAGPFYNQNFTLCATDPVLGLVLTPTRSVYVSGL